MKSRYSFVIVALFGIASLGCQTPYGGSCAGGCCDGSCGVGGSSSTAYYPSTAPADSTPQPSLPPTYHGGSGSR